LFRHSNGCLAGEAIGIYGLRVLLCFAEILSRCNDLDFAFSHQISQADITQKLVNLITEVRPEVMGQALFALLTVTFITAARRVQ
jgi:hypothetical protein